MSIASKNFLRSLVDPENANIDIVAVHGLNPIDKEFHAEATWTAGDKLWLKDFLPTKLPQARVLLFGYNSNVAFKTSIAGVHEQAVNLLNRLWLKRRQVHDRPIIFIAHSLGGIVVKHALFQAKAGDRYSSIRAATYGIVFFGTPHQGGNYAKLGGIAARICRVLLRNDNNTLMENRETDSLFSGLLIRDFRQQLEDYYIISFFETVSFNKLGLIVDQKSATLGLPATRETCIGIDADHTGICKFESSDGDDYEQVEGNIIALVEAAIKNFEDQFRLAALNSEIVARHEYVGHYSRTGLRPVATIVRRPALLQKVKEQLHDRVNTLIPDGPIVVVYGLGGAGKSQLVLDYLQEYRRDYSATFWIRAGTQQSIEQDYLQIYQLLFNIQIKTETEFPKARDTILAVKNYFNGRDGQWLFIFDGADTIVEEKDESVIDLAMGFSGSNKVHTIITTRNSLAKNMTTTKPVEVGEMEVTEASELFIKCAKLRDRPQESEVELIVKELGCLALAVNLAGCYVSATPRIALDLQEYLPEYRRRRKDLLKQKPKKLIHQYTESVLTTWETSFNHISRRCMPAARFLTLLAFLNSDDIFMDLFHTNDIKGSNTLIWPLIVSPEKQIDKYAVEDYFRTLQEYSLLQIRQDHQSYSMHKLVHAWGFDRLELSEQNQYSHAALQLLEQIIRKGQMKLAAKIQLVPHVIENFGSVSRIYESSNFCNDDIIKLLFMISRFLGKMGRYKDDSAVGMFLANACKKAYNEEYPFTISAMVNLSNTLADQGKLDEAASMQQEALEKMMRILSDEHLHTISAKNNLASMLLYQGKLDEAASMQQDVLEKRKRILGEEHLDTILAMNNLASMLAGQGKLDEAALMQQQVLEKMTRVLGDEHPDTIWAIHNLAITLSDQGKLDEAASMQQEVLEKRKRVLGDEHPHTIWDVRNLTVTLGRKKKLYSDTK